MTLLELSPDDTVVYDPDTGYGYLLTRAPARRGHRSYDAVMADLERVERVWQRELEDLLSEEADRVAARVRSSSRRLARYLKPAAEVRRDSLGSLLSRLFDRIAFKRRMKARVRGLYEAAVDVALDDVNAAVGVGFNVKPSPATQRMITSRANQLAGYVADSTYKQIQRVLQRGIQEGDAIPDLAARVQDTLKRASVHRATVIARTEVISAYNGGAYAAGTDLPGDVVTGMQWIATQDSRTRPAHRAADGQVVAKGDTFTVGGEELRYPGDPAGRPGNTINCRCALRLLTPLDDVTVPPRKRSPGPYVSRALAQDVLTRVALERCTAAEALLEVRGEKAGHVFHGNQWNGGGKPMTRNQAVSALRAAGYTGPVSFSVPQLNAIHAAVKGQGPLSAVSSAAARTKAARAERANVRAAGGAAPSPAPPAAPPRPRPPVGTPNVGFPQPAPTIAPAVPAAGPVLAAHRRPGAVAAGKVADPGAFSDAAYRASSRGTQASDGTRQADPQLYEMVKARGFHGLPTKVTHAEMDAAIKDGAIEAYRGVSQDYRRDATHTEGFKKEFIDGNYFAGLGIYGNGTYMAAVGVEGPTRYGPPRKSDHGISNLGPETQASAYQTAKNYGAVVTRIGIKADAKIVDHMALTTEAAKLPQGKGYHDMGKAAVALGYDGFYVQSAGYAVVVNRTALLVVEGKPTG